MCLLPEIHRSGRRSGKPGVSPGEQSLAVDHEHEVTPFAPARQPNGRPASFDDDNLLTRKPGHPLDLLFVRCSPAQFTCRACP